MSKSKKRPFLPDASFRFDETSILMFRTNMLNYEFVAALNQACELQLARVDDIPIESACYPCFSQYDSAARLAFVAIERSKQETCNPCMGYYDKMLLVNGRDAFEFQQRLYGSLAGDRPEPPAQNILEHMQWQNMNDLGDGIFAVDTFCFDERRGVSTSMYPGAPEAMPKNTQTYLAKLKKFISSTFENLEWHLCEEE